ncbi:MAG: hypothetical protein JXP48_13140 [Acidobacteria bacterium]|nr:hypothetical protein [Acidobacteriota bacterium]
MVRRKSSTIEVIRERIIRTRAELRRLQAELRLVEAEKLDRIQIEQRQVSGGES